MTLHKHVNGTVIDADEQNQDHAEGYQIALLGHIRLLQDRAATYSAGQQDLWGEAYIDADGRNDSVTAATTAGFSSNKYVAHTSSCVFYRDFSSTQGTNNINYCYSTDGSTFSDLSFSVDRWKNGVASYPYIFKDTTNSVIMAQPGQSGGNREDVALKYTVPALFNGKQLFLTGTFTGDPDTGLGDGVIIYIKVNSTVKFTQAVTTNSQVVSMNVDLGTVSTGDVVTFDVYRVSNNNYDSFTLSNDTSIGESTPISATVDIVHTIPTGTFSATCSTAIGAALISDWETGADIKYKLTNGSEDSGWLNCGVVPVLSTFTAFTSEPTTLTVELIPKTSSPTADYPAIYGFALRCT